MPEPHTAISDLAQEVLEIPRAHVAVELRQDETGLKLFHQGQALVECFLTREGMAAGAYMSKALGARVPALGQATPLNVSTGVLFRAVSIASLDFSVQESFALLDRWLEEAEMQRGGSSDAT